MPAPRVPRGNIPARVARRASRSSPRRRSRARAAARARARAHLLGFLRLIPPPGAPRARPRQATFDDLDSLESGHAREYVPAELLNPPLPGAVGGPGVDTKRRWVHCRVTRRDKTRFEMRTEVGGVFMLSAALDRKRGCFYISSYEQFPEWGPGSAGGTPKFVAVLTRETADGAEQSAASGAFRLRLCGAAAVAAAGGGGGGKALGARASALGVGALGPPLASMSHSVTHLKQAGADMRSLSVSMPEIRFGNAHYLYGQPAPGGAPAPPPPPGVGRQLTLRNRLPEWNEQWNCLYLKFNRGRVKESSSKNFLVYDAAVLDGAPHIDGRAAGTDDAILQFGKVAPGTFVLDFRAPISALQAFGIALSAFAFKI